MYIRVLCINEATKRDLQILATSINSTGGAAPPGAPVGEAQRDAMIHAFRRSGKDPRDVDFVEMHATGKVQKILIVHLEY